MRKINRTMASLTAAVLALGSSSAYVAFADAAATPAMPETLNFTSVSTNFKDANANPDAASDSDTDWNAAKGYLGDYTATLSGNTVTVKFAKTKAQIKGITDTINSRQDLLWISVKTDDPNYVDESNANFSFTGGYGFDDNSNKQYNIDGGNIMLWLDPIANDDNTIMFKRSSSDPEKTLKVKYEYAAESAITFTSPSTDFPGAATMTGYNDWVKLMGGAPKVTASGDTVTVEFKRTETEMKNAFAKISSRGSAGKDFLWLSVNGGNALKGCTINNTAATDFTFVSGYSWDDVGNKAFNYDATNGKIMLWLNPLQKKTPVVFKKGTNGDPHTLNIVYKYAEAAAVTASASATVTNDLAGGVGVLTAADIGAASAADLAAATVKMTIAPKTADDAKKEEALKDVDVLAAYDITIKAKIGAADEKAITKTGEKIKIVLPVPSTVKETSLAVVPVHNGKKGAVIPDEDKDAKTVTISVDEFSTFALVKAPVAAPTTTTVTPTPIPGMDKPGDTTSSATSSDTSAAESDTSNTSASTSDTTSGATSNTSGTTSGGTTSGETKPGSNPNTGVALALAPVILAGAAVAVISVKKRK